MLNVKNICSFPYKINNYLEQVYITLGNVIKKYYFCRKFRHGKTMKNI